MVISRTPHLQSYYSDIINLNLEKLIYSRELFDIKYISEILRAIAVGLASLRFTKTMTVNL